MKYFLIRESNNTTVEFENYIQLINYLSKYNDGWVHTNKILNDIKICDGDVRYGRIPDSRHWKHYLDIKLADGNIHRCFSLEVWDYGYIPRSTRIINEFGNNVVDARFKRDVLSWKYDENINRQHIKYVNRNRKQNYYQRWGYLPDSAYKFREGPWPMIHRRYRWVSYRLPRTTSEKRANADPDIKEFVRAGRNKEVPTARDDIPRSDAYVKSWKHQTKCRHQWEHNAQKKSSHQYGKNTYVYKMPQENQTASLEEAS